MDAEALYGLPLEEFTRQRDALARVLREAGEREQAAAVVALRKPTLVAWAVNQLARAHAREVDLLLDASHRLIEAQTGASPSESASVAATRQRDALAALVRRGRELLGPRATATTIARVADTLRAASLTPTAASAWPGARSTARSPRPAGSSSTPVPPRRRFDRLGVVPAPRGRAPGRTPRTTPPGGRPPRRLRPRLRPSERPA